MSMMASGLGSGSIQQFLQPKPLSPAPSVGATQPAAPAGSYLGQNLQGPSPVHYPAMQAGNIQSYINAYQTGQNQSNDANAARYNQGIGVLSGGANQATDYLNQAQQNLAGIGQAQAQEIERQRQAASGHATQSAISRGLGDTTVTDALQQGVQHTADLANIANNESVARQQSGLYQAQAGQTDQSANSLAGFIANRNDTGPSLGEISGLISGMASNPGTGGRSGTIMGGPGGAPPPLPPVNSGSGGGGGAMGSGGFFSGSGYNGFGGANAGSGGFATGGYGSNGGSIGGYLGNYGTGQGPTSGSQDTGGGYAFFGNGGYVGPGGYVPSASSGGSLQAGGGATELPGNQSSAGDTGDATSQQIASLRQMVGTPADGDGYYSAMLQKLLSGQA